MDDYIKREALLEDIEHSVVFTVRPDVPSAELRGANKIIDRIRSAPAADVAEVRHGRWLTTDGFPHRVYCSCCYSTYVPNDNWQIWQDKPGEGGLPRGYCPNCGAKMDGGEDDATD